MILELLKNAPITNAINNFNGVVANLSIQQEALYLAASHHSSLIIVKPTLYTAQQLYHALHALIPNDVLLFQSDESLRFESIAASPETTASMIENLYLLQHKKVKIVVTHLQAYLRFLPTKKIFNKYCLSLTTNQTISKQTLETFLIKAGYQKVSRVDRPLTFASRGSIIDIFSIQHDDPIRIEFFDIEIENIRFFNVATQKTINMINAVDILPATTILFSDEEINEIQSKISNIPHKQLQNHLTAELDFLKQHHTDLKYYRFYALLNNHTHLNDYINGKIIYSSKSQLSYAYHEMVKENSQFINELSNQNEAIHDIDYYFNIDNLEYHFDIDQFHEQAIESTIQPLLTTSVDKEAILTEMIRRSNECTVIAAVNDFQIALLKDRITSTHNIHFINQPLPEGFIIGNTYIYTAKELFNERVTPYKKHNKFKDALILKNYQELAINDYIVHEKYGIGRYLGIVTKFQNNVNKDYLSVEYNNATKLFIPVEQFQLVRKYLSKDALTVKLSTIGTTQWSKEKEKIQKGIEELANQLLELYTYRNTQIGFKYAQDDLLQEKFENDFQHELTFDQRSAINEIKKDMESDKIMDRLLCGDVGFGKTEVAAVSAFKAVANGKQVAYLCPTTILSNQHYHTFKKRFKNFPVNIKLLNRFTSTKDTKSIIEATKNGLVDIVIGTHRILSKDVSFKNLGLLIIDEEQRFGVSQKEKIKQLKNTVDVLSLSATPIPRTLQMSLIGIRGLSQINTPPKNRYSVQTYILEENEHSIKNIIEREIARNGQVFYLHNNIEDIYEIANQIQNAIPHAKVAIGHGKMSKNEIEDVMIQFIEHEFNVLICTTIIETGIDIPNANTIIIHDADKFGLAQLYQIRGRVGRGDKIAYAYLMYQRGKQLTQEAIARLQAIKEFATLGSGYKIAMRDLSIRGAGDMLGGKQAGFIDSVGMDMYIDMLSSTLQEKKGIQINDNKINATNIAIDSYIPQSFTDNDMEKLQIYQTINKINQLEQLNVYADDLIDNFGKLPQSVINIIEKRKLDILLSHQDIQSYSDSEQLIAIVFTKDYSYRINGEAIFTLTNEYSNDVKISYSNQSIHLTFRKFKDYLPILTQLLIQCINLKQ